MTDHDGVRELLAPVALGAAEPEEEVLVEAHIATCGSCRAELEQLTMTATGLALMVPQEDPPVGLKRSIMDVVEQDAAVRRRIAPRERTASGIRAWLPRRAGAWPALAGGLAAACVAIGAWAVATDGGEPAPDVQRLEASARLAGVSGEALVLGDGDAAVVRLSGLGPLDAGRGYELWAIDGTAAPRSVGFMATTPGSGGEVYAVVEDLDGATALAVTREELTNTTAPTETPIVTVALG